VADSSARAGVPLAVPQVVERVRPLLRRDVPLAPRPLANAAILDAALNLLIFIPFALLAGLALEARGWQPSSALGVAFVATAVFSLAVESAQYFTVSRSSEIQDVALNVVSGGLGGLLFLVSRRRAGTGASR
jgi:glycopeptide antibiotics resistance protein